MTTRRRPAFGSTSESLTRTSWPTFRSPTASAWRSMASACRPSTCTAMKMAAWATCATRPRSGSRTAAKGVRSTRKGRRGSRSSIDRVSLPGWKDKNFTSAQALELWKVACKIM